MELYIIRHGETKWNSEKRLQGRSDIELNEYGIELARITSEALKDVKFDRIYSSPLKRAYETAEILRGSRKLDIICDDRLMEMCFGDYEGKVTDTLPDEFWKFFDDPVNFVPAGNGETYEQVIERAKDFLYNVIVPLSYKIDRMLVVAHGAFNRALMISLNHQGIKDYWEGVFQKNCCVNIYEINGDNFKLIQNGKIYYEDKGGKDYRK